MVSLTTDCDNINDSKYTLIIKCGFARMDPMESTGQLWVSGFTPLYE